MKKSVFILMFAAGIILALLCGPVAAFEPLPNESGFDGFVRLGGGYSWVKSNMIAGSDLGDVGKRRIDSLRDSPDSKSDVVPQFNWNVKYTFASTRTQLFAGSRLEDIFRFDATTQAGVRQEFQSLGIMGASFVFTTLPTEVWRDPYVVDDRRKKTDRTSRGIRLAWERMFNSNFELDYIYRDIDINTERSGDALGRSGSDKDRLKRKGDSHQLKGAYFFEIGKNQLLSPQLIFDYEDLDGDAMKNYKTDFQLTSRKTPFTAKPRTIRVTAWVLSGPGRIPSAGSRLATINFGCIVKSVILCPTRTSTFMTRISSRPLRASGWGSS